MVDTVKIRFTGTLRDKVPERRGMKLSGGIVRFYHDGFGGCKAEAELPKLLWGHNGYLLANQAELDQCVELLRVKLLTIVEFTSWQWVLIDLCWQFEARAADVILAHQWLRFPGVRKLPTLYHGGEGISWRGTKRSLKLYDKARQMFAGADALRAELRLAGKELRQKIDANAPLNFAELWRVYRSELIGLCPVELLETRKYNFAEVIASLAPEVQNRALLAYQQHRTSRAVSEFKRAVSGAHLNRIPWNWSDQLPVNAPPPPVNVEPRRSV